MSDNGKIEKEEAAQQEPKPISLVVTLLPDGKVNLTGPITNRMLCYGLLKMAEEILYDFSKAQKANIVLPKQHGIMDFIRGKN